MFYQSLYPARKPNDFAAYRATLRANLAEPGRFAATEAVGEARARGRTLWGASGAPVMIVMGSKDPDFPSPEAGALASRTPVGRVAIIEGAGHYPQAEMPEQFTPIALTFPYHRKKTGGEPRRIRNRRGQARWAALRPPTHLLLITKL